MAFETPPSNPSTVTGGEAAAWLTDPGGGSSGRPWEVAWLIGGSDCEYGPCWRVSHEFNGWLGVMYVHELDC